MAKFVNMENLGSQDVVTFPPLDKDRLGSSMSGRLIYYPNPLPYPEKLPITRTVGFLWSILKNSYSSSCKVYIMAEFLKMLHFSF